MKPHNSHSKFFVGLCMLALMLYGAVTLFIGYVWPGIILVCNRLDMQPEMFLGLLGLAAVVVMVWRAE